MKNMSNIKKIITLLSQAPPEQLRFELWDLFLTPTELEQLSTRYEIIKGLMAQELTQRELSAELKLSIAKITRGSNELKRCSPELKAYLTNFFTTKEQ